MRAVHDVKFYDAALELQIKNPLPAGCSGVEFSRRAAAFIVNIRNNLARKFTDEDASDFLLNTLLPKELRPDGRRIRGEMVRDGAGA